MPLAEKKIAIDKAMLKFVIIGVILVLASGVAMIVVQANSIGGSIQDAVATKFGNVWLSRMLQSGDIGCNRFFYLSKGRQEKHKSAEGQRYLLY